MDALQRRMSEVEANQLSVRLELQADFFAGVIARHVQNQGLLETGDIEEACGPFTVRIARISFEEDACRGPDRTDIDPCGCFELISNSS